MYGITINGMASSGIMQTPRRLRTFEWSNFLAVLHSVMKSSAVDDEKATNKSRVSLCVIRYYVYILSNTLFTVLTATSIVLFSSDV